MVILGYSFRAMARDKKPIELRPVEEAPLREEEVVRLEKDQVVVRLVQERVDVRPKPEARLEVPDVSDAESKRTHEPGVEVLMDAEAVEITTDEHAWGESEAKRAPLPWGWFALLGLVLVGAVVWSVIRMMDAHEKVESVKQRVEADMSGAVLADSQLQASFDRMEAVVKGFCQAATVDELARWVRHPARVRPLMERFYAAEPLKPIGYQRQKDFQGAMLGARNNFWLVKVVTGSGRTKALLVEEGDDGSFGVDWETAVVYQPMPWDKYAQDRPRGTRLDFRVHVAADNFFSHEFANADQWSCFQLNVPGAEETLWGYAAKGSEAEAILTETLKRNPEPNKPVAVALRLELPEGLKSRRGVIIERVLSTRWLFIESPDAAP
jgi:hypothetical protein